jgi:hypothetical protein
VRNATKPGKYFDGHGLSLKINESGGKSWVQRIVIRGKRRELGLGSAQLVSLADAREAALAGGLTHLATHNRVRVDCMQDRDTQRLQAGRRKREDAA